MEFREKQRRFVGPKMRGIKKMFSKAVPIATGFTRPVVISSRTTQGVCDGTIGAYVVINREGWILTAGHLLDIVRSQQDSARRHAGYACLSGWTIHDRGRRRRLPLPRTGPTSYLTGSVAIVDIASVRTVP